MTFPGVPKQCLVLASDTTAEYMAAVIVLALEAVLLKLCVTILLPKHAHDCGLDIFCFF